VTIADASRISRYAFGTGTADFLVCATCGVAPVVTSEIEGRLHAVVSVHAFENVERARIREMPISFEGEAVGERLARRQRNWIGDVEIVEARGTAA
jgi:hypothetical protein